MFFLLEFVIIIISFTTLHISTFKLKLSKKYFFFIKFVFKEACFQVLPPKRQEGHFRPLRLYRGGFYITSRDVFETPTSTEQNKSVTLVCLLLTSEHVKEILKILKL